MRVSILKAASAVLVGSLISSCVDSAAPRVPAGPPDATSLISGPTQMNVVTRNAPLATALTASADIGILGGQIRLPEAGLTVIVPALALTTTTTITVTAVVGNQVAYEFEPHGLQFNVPLVVTQSLAGTSASQNGLFPGVLYGGYFADLSALNPLRGTALVDEILRVSIDRALGTATFSVIHFSGYLLGTGETNPGDGEGLR